MTTFDKREKGFEQKFAHDADLKFKAESRRNKALAEWAGAKLGLSGADLEDYIKAVRKADLAEKGDDDVYPQSEGRSRRQGHHRLRDRAPLVHDGSARQGGRRYRELEGLIAFSHSQSSKA